MHYTGCKAELTAALSYYKRSKEMKFVESKYAAAIGKITMAAIAKWLYADGYKQTSSRYAVLTKEDGETLTDSGPALVKAVRKLERGIEQ